MVHRRFRLVAALAVLGVGAGLLSACGAAEPRNLLASIRSGYVVLGTKYDQPGLGLRDPVDNDLVGFDPTVSRFVVNPSHRSWACRPRALSGGKRRRRNARR